MKTPFRALFPILRPLPTIVFLSFVGQAALLAQTSGTWTLDGSGNWSTPENWSPGSIASGATATADFSTLDITGDTVVTLDSPFTIGTLVSQDATTPSHSWTLGGAGPLTLDNGASPPVLNVINQSLAISAPLAGTNGFRKNGAGTLDLSVACTYSGGTTLDAGTLKTSGGNDRLPAGTTLAFTGTAGTLDLTTTTQTLAGLTVPNGLAASYAISGTSLTLSGAADRQLGPGGAVTASHSVALDMSGLSSFTSTAPANLFRVGLKAGSSNATGGGSPGQAATVVLADQNAITASILAIGDIAANSHGGTSTLRLGRVNTLNVGSINTGASGRSNSNLLFDPGRINPSVTIRNTDGTSAVTEWRVGQVANFNTTVWTDIVDLSAGTVNALVTTVTVGTADITIAGRGGTENASFTMGAGTLEAATLLLGRISGANTTTITSVMAGNGTYTLNHPSGVVKATTLTLAENTTLAGGTAARSVSGTFNLTAGTLEATTIQRGAQTGNATATAAVNWTDGTIRNLTPSGLAINTLPLKLLTGSHIFDATGSATITVDATSTVSGTGGLTKTGTGTLSLQGANTYSGPTNVQAGTLAISNSFPNSSAFTVDAAATLELANVTLSGLPALDLDGSLNLTGPVTVGGPLTAIPGTLAGVLQYGSITGAANLKHNYRNASFTVGATATDLNVAAGLPLTWAGAGGTSGDWDLNTTVSWKDASNNPEKFFWADSVTFDSAGNGTPNVNLTAEMQPAAVTVNEAAVDYVFSGPGFVSGTTVLTKNGAAKLTIATNNTNTGTTTINAGTLEIGSGGTTGWMGSGAIVNNGTLVFDRSNDITVANALSGTGSVTKLGAGVVRLTADNSYAGGTTISAGALHVGTQTTTTGSLGTGPIVNNSTLRLNRADGITNPYTYTFANDISGTGELIVGQNGAGVAFDSVVTLTGSNSFSGNITVSSGGLKILNKDSLGAPPKTIILTNGTNGRPQFYLDGSGGNITVPAGFSFDTSSDDGNRPVIGNLAGDNVIEGNITLKSGGGNTQIKVLGGSLTLNGQISLAASTRNLRLAGNAGTNGTINGKLTNGSNPWGLFVIGSNTWTLTNSTNDITGNTTVSGGTLLANNASGSATGTGTITVTTGTFGGTGGVSGTVTVNAAGILAPGGGGTESLATGALTLNDTSTLAIDIHTGTGACDQLLVTGNVDLAGTVNLTLNDLGANTALPAGTKLVVADYSGVWDDTDIVHFNGSPVPNGSTITFGANTFTVDYSDDSLGGTAMTLTTPGVANPYSGWADSFSLVGANRAPGADPDNDGLQNGVEFVIGANPNTFTPQADRPGATVSGGNLVFTFKRSDASESFDVYVEHGTTLAAWPGQILIPVVATPGPPINVADNGPASLDDVTVTIPMGTDPKKFARLRADIPFTP